MRIWSVHPKYLDAKGLVALWRETLLAKKVLEGNTEGYRNHSQLKRFKQSDRPLNCINRYLDFVYEEAKQRGYSFSENKIDFIFNQETMPVTQGQMEYEFQHLLGKLKTRSPEKYAEIKHIAVPEPHPLFKIIPGEIESWEVIS